MKHFVLSFLLIAGLTNQVKSSFSNNLPPITHTPATKRGVHPLTYNSVSSYVKAPKHTALKGLSRFTAQDKLAGKIVYTDTTVTSANARQGNGAVSSSANLAYTLAAAARTSAGVYDGEVLIRTLWNNEQRNAGTYDLSTVWDGKDDNGNNVADKNYTIKVVSNNVTYDWLRPIGNTSVNSSGSDIHHSMQMYTNMVQVGNDMYCANGYNEVGDSHVKFSIGQPNRLTTTLKGGSMVPRFLASDGTRVYYTGQGRDKVTFTTAITPNPTGTDALYSFSTGRQIRITGNNDYQYSGIDYDTVGNFPTGLAVQKTGDRLLISHASSNEVRVFNKTTGALVRSSTLPGARHLAFQSDNIVWLSKYSSHTGVTTSGKLSGTQIGSDVVGNNPISNAFDQTAGTYFRTTGGAFNYVGMEFATRQVITQVRIKANDNTSLSAKILGYDGWESVELGTITSTNGAWATINVTNRSPFRQIKIDNHDGPNMFIDEVEFYGYSYSGVPTVSRHTVNSDGTLGAATLTLSGITEPLALAVSPDGAKIAVVDRGAYHQVKFFNTSSGALLSTLGRAETYTNPAVYNDKFYFNNTRIFRDDDYGTAHAFVAFQADGSYWVGDYGNMRCQHFAPDGGYIDNIQHLGFSYNCQADISKPTRVFSSFLEFEVDYTNNSWTFVKNWTQGVKNPYEYEEGRFRSVITLTNGRTYALFSSSNSGPREILELIPTTGVRHTGIFMESFLGDLHSDGSQWIASSYTVGQPIVYKRRPLTGFDGNNNPVWGAAVTLETVPNLTYDDPYNDQIKRNQQTTTGVIATFNTDNGKGLTGKGYHLGGIKNGRWIFKTSPSTRINYIGDYPADGAFDIGNGVNFAGSFMQVVDQNIFWGYKGEFWKSGQTNMHNHYLDNGLMVGQFGVPGDVARTYGEAPPMMAGNATTGTYIKIGSDIHLFHCDESHHSAIHHWKISNLSSIQTQSFTFTKIGTLNLPSLPYTDLMAGLPVNETITSRTGRWTFSPGTYDRGTYDLWKVQAGLSTYKRDDRSLRFTSYPTANGLTREGYCNLSVTSGIVNNYSTWQITGRLTYPEISEPNENFIDVLDNGGKVIVRISRPENWPNATVKVNNTSIISGGLNGLMRRLFQNAQDLSIQRDGNNILVSYAGYPKVSVTAFDPTANLNSPTTLRIHFYSAGTNGHQIDLANLRFYSTPTVINGTGTGLTAEYFNNRTLTAPVSTTRVDATVNFNWNLNSPIPGTIGVDDFSVRWSGQVQAPVSGDYVFSTACDDGVRLWVNGVLVINNWAYHSSTDNSAPITLTAGQKYDIKLEYYEALLGAKVSLLWAYPGQSQQTIPKERLYPATLTASGAGTGLAAQYYNNRTLTAPVSTTRVDATVNFNWNLNSPIPGTIGVDDFSVRWSGQVQAPVSGDYVFSTACDDGVRLWVNGVLVINNWAYHSSTDNSAPITLTAGQKYDIKLEYYEALLGAKVSLLWAYPGQSQQTIPKERLYPATLTASGGRLSTDNSEIDPSTVFHVYPIPAQDFFWVQYYAEETGDVSIRLFNENAQSVLQSVHQVTQGENKLRISVTGLPRGIYLINLRQGSGQVSKRVILSD